MPDLDRQSQGLGSRPALIVVDVINGFTDPACPLGSPADDVVSACARLLDAFRAHELPVFFTTVVFHDDQQAHVFRRRLPALNVLEPGSHWTMVDERLAPRDGEPVIEKQSASAFFGTDLAGRLTAAGVDSLVVVGLTTSGCVRATAVDGLQHDFPVVVAREATGDRNLEAHEANLLDLDAKYADVVSADEVLSAIRETAQCTKDQAAGTVNLMNDQ
ncbi:MAG: isochorismatase family protein [Xanthomonadales bacterium]|nr:isochorismatase family protein [Xanthomonadales bacterium]